MTARPCRHRAAASAATAAWTLLAAAALPAASAQAEEAFEPHLSGALSIETQTDSILSSSDRSAEITDSYATIEAGVTAHIAPLLSVTASTTFEPVKDPVGDRAFEDHGLYINELYVQIGDDYVLQAGKISPAFGIGWDAAPGLYGTTFAEDYELSEMIGLSAQAPLPFGDGAHRLSAAAFFTDTTALSDSVFKQRGRTEKSDGGLANTETLENVAVALEGEVMGTGYAVGFRRLAAGVAETEDEFGYSLALTRAFALGEGEISVIGEAAMLQNADGAEGERLYGLIGAAYAIDNWTFSGAYALRDADAAEADHLATLSVEYDIGYGFSVGAGYAYLETGGDSSHQVGAVAAYAIEF